MYYIERTTGEEKKEQVYGEGALKLLYGDGLASKTVGKICKALVAKNPFFSKFYGYLQKRAKSRKKIEPFIEKYGIDTSEFESHSFESFNDFFVRKLKSSARPIVKSSQTATIPADGRYLFYQDIQEADGFVVKGKKFCLESFLGDAKLAEKYSEGSMAIARLCPTDYHRYHFPCDCVPEETELLNGALFSVNPMAIKKNISIFAENKRTLCSLKTENFGTVLYLEVGATCVGSIHQTYKADKKYKKGDEKGFFSFGGSTIVLLFEKNKITFDKDLLTQNHLEVRCLMGQSMGKSKNS